MWNKLNAMKICPVFFSILLIAGFVGIKPATAQDALAAASWAQRLSILEQAATYLGTPYASPPNVPNNFDCSGFVSYIFAQFGYTLPPTTSSYGSVGTSVSWEDTIPGDLLIFSSTKGSSTVNHVAILWEKGANGDLAGSWIIHSASINTGKSMLYGDPSTKTGVVITQLGLRGDGIIENEYFYQRYMHSIRVLGD
jgi:cell wall-associated NlpC family hydrolase